MEHSRATDNTTFAYNLADVNGTLHDVAERSVSEATGFFTNETWLRQHIRATETFSADSNVVFRLGVRRSSLSE